MTEGGVVQLTVAGVLTSVHVSGQQDRDTAVVFVHGNPGTGADWRPVIPRLSDYTHCVAPTMPGYGDGPQPAGFDYTVDGYATFLGAVLDAMEVRRAHLVTHDLGGIWGLAWAASQPDRLASLTLMSIGVLPDYRWHRYARLYRIPLIGELVLAGAGPSSVRRSLQAGTVRAIPEGFVQDVARQYRNPGTRRAVLAFYRATQDLGPVTTRAVGAIATAELPTLVIWGAGDPYVPARYAQLQQQFFPRAKVVILPDSGHWPLVDDPAPVIEAVVGFLREQIAPTAGSRPPADG